MRHRKAGRRLNRNMAHREATLRNMAASLFKHSAITTGLAKAKELRSVAEPLITLAKNDTVANRRLAFARLRDDEAVSKLFATIAPANQTRPGGYTRILKMGHRLGDKCQMARVELVGLGETAAPND